MIDVYTDASVSKGKAAATCFVLTPNAYLGCRTFEYDNINSGIHGELVGLRDGIKYALEVVKDSTEPITVYCDSSSAINLIKDKCAKSHTFKEIVTDINSLCDGHTVHFMLIKGHQVSHNPNKVVDLISNSVLRIILKGN